MPLVTYKDLCVDVADLQVARDFWAPTLGLDVVPDGDGSGEIHLEGPTPQHTVWPCVVPEPKTVKNRVHLDVHAGVPLIPGTTRLSEPGEFRWTVVAGPEGDEICTFVRDEVPEYRLYEVAVDAADHASLAVWWQQLWGGRLGHDEDGCSWIDGIAGVPFEGFTFESVPESKTVKNRIHWDVRLAGGASVDDVLDAGATLLRAPDDEIEWAVLADPEGNEFCVFAQEAP
ncbi:VOC family protein [Aeromicrobium sp. CTD01-1L150]|uniref:VOC family protein n=1 Tax=Aeromicrobium sp. CTD01-1L150 TaxID=3341830 RepID=UPI0035BF0965